VFRNHRSKAQLPIANLYSAFELSKTVPHAFVLDALTPADPTTRPMFGCLAVYLHGKLVFVLRDKPNKPFDNGVWLATTKDHHESLRAEFPNMRSIRVLAKGVTEWQVLPADAEDFEESAVRACELVLARDPRIGRVPGARRPERMSVRKQTNSSTRVRTRKTAAGNAAAMRGRNEGRSKRRSR